MFAVGWASTFKPDELGQRLALASSTISGQGVTHLRGNWNKNTETTIGDTINLSSNLGSVQTSTPSAKLALGVAELLKSATHVDPATGQREINQGIGDKLSSQLSQILSSSGFSKSAATAASQSLVQQFSGISSNLGNLAISLDSQTQNAGSYNGSVSGGQETASWAAVSKTTLGISFDQATGDLAVNLDRHEISAGNISWASASASDVSIVLNPQELQAFSSVLNASSLAYDINTSHAKSSLQETATFKSSDTGGGVEGGNEPNNASNAPAMLAISPAPDPAAGQVTSILHAVSAAAPGTSQYSLNGQSSDSGSSTALKTLTAVLKQMQEAKATEQLPNQSVKVTLSNGIGIGGMDQNGGTFVTYTRPSGQLGGVKLSNLNVSA